LASQQLRLDALFSMDGLAAEVEHQFGTVAQAIQRWRQRASSLFDHATERHEMGALYLFIFIFF
jgi:hypothetical protein